VGILSKLLPGSADVNQVSYPGRSSWLSKARRLGLVLIRMQDVRHACGGGRYMRCYVTASIGEVASWNKKLLKFILAKSKQIYVETYASKMNY